MRFFTATLPAILISALATSVAAAPVHSTSVGHSQDFKSNDDLFFNNDDEDFEDEDEFDLEKRGFVGNHVSSAAHSLHNKGSAAYHWMGKTFVPTGVRNTFHRVADPITNRVGTTLGHSKVGTKVNTWHHKNLQTVQHNAALKAGGTEVPNTFKNQLQQVTQHRANHPSHSVKTAVDVTNAGKIIVPGQKVAATTATTATTGAAKQPGFVGRTWNSLKSHIPFVGSKTPKTQANAQTQTVAQPPVHLKQD